ncbi:hypothetical protein CEXT_65711 [Caerostris extrusa]|uniref:Uncharacterized protein n=1 Tax=Caerostris extrusa TaxID=172846 RepID=A0AAV4R207_CAEEX|nr:hypothetical protein CEXT_65711 [Caerostris extrusa]
MGELVRVPIFVPIPGNRETPEMVHDENRKLDFLLDGLIKKFLKGREDREKRLGMGGGFKIQVTSSRLGQIQIPTQDESRHGKVAPINAGNKIWGPIIMVFGSKELPTGLAASRLDTESKLL